MEEKNLENEFIKQFNEVFGTKINKRFDKTPLLLNIYHDCIEQSFKSNKIYEEILDNILSIEDELKGSFTDRQKDLFKKWDFYTDKLNNYSCEESFIYGYCLDKELQLEKEKRINLKKNKNLMDIINLINQKYSDNISLILDKDLLIIQYMYIRNGERDIYKLLQIKEFEDKFYIKFIDEKIEKIITIQELEDIFEMYKKQSNKKELTQIEINSLKEKYIKGTKIELIKMYDIQEIKPKTKGVVDFVDDIGQIHIKWENGMSLPLNIGVDEFKII